jgi:hypothetical protein
LSFSMSTFLPSPIKPRIPRDFAVCRNEFSWSSLIRTSPFKTEKNFG